MARDNVYKETFMGVLTVYCSILSKMVCTILDDCLNSIKISCQWPQSCPSPFIWYRTLYDPVIKCNNLAYYVIIIPIKNAINSPLFNG